MFQCELVCIGNEVLSGHTVNGNAAFLGKLFEQHGIACSRHSVLPDSPDILLSELRQALSRSDLVITTGGLGPTVDDRTRQVLADLFACDLAFDPIVAAKLEQRYGKGRASIEDQATIPSCAKVLLNSVGTAPGLVLDGEGGTLVALPGVPMEFHTLLEEEVLPWLQTRFPKGQSPERRILNVCCHTESSVDRLLRKLGLPSAEVDVGIYPGLGTVSVHLIGNASAALDAAEAHLREEFGAKGYYAASLPLAIQEHFLERGLTLSTAESCTGGKIAASVTENSGSSGYFLGGVVSYSNEMKQSVLGVKEETLIAHGAVSQQTVEEMAKGVQALTGSDYSLSVSGVAGPSGGSAEKPVGTVWLGMAGPGGEVYSRLLQAPQSRRERIMLGSVNQALGLLWQHL